MQMVFTVDFVCQYFLIKSKKSIEIVQTFQSDNSLFFQCCSGYFSEIPEVKKFWKTIFLTIRV